MNIAKTMGTIAARLGRPAPLSLTFELTHLCNLACDYCDRHTPMSNEMTREQILKALAEFIDLGTRKVKFDGGEPLAHKHIDEFVAWLIERDISTGMNTNGILVPKKIETIKQLSQVRISLDGPRDNHDSMRGKGSFDKAIRGAVAARDAGVPKVDFTCVIGKHNANAIDELIDLVEELELSVIFQPARPSLFLGNDRDGKAFVPNQSEIMTAFGRVEARKRQGKAVGNRWSSLRHFRALPRDVNLPCAAGWIHVTMDPEGSLYHCGQIARQDDSNNVTRLGARAAFDGLSRKGCTQCWCARVVERNYTWGLRYDKLLPMMDEPVISDPSPSPSATP